MDNNLILHTLFYTFGKDRLVAIVTLSVLISKESLKAIVTAALRLIALFEEIKFAVVLGSGAILREILKKGCTVVGLGQEDKRKEKEEWMFLKQKSSEKLTTNFRHMYKEVWC